VCQSCMDAIFGDHMPHRFDKDGNRLKPESMAFWAIRLKGSDRYLPQVKRQHGYSFTEPTSIEQEPPRLFFTERSAHLSLAQWLRGHHKKTRSGGYSWDGEYDYEEYIDVVHQPHRKLEDMEVVEFAAVERED
jgi:hypothetical protein